MDLQLENIATFLLKTESKLSDNYDDTKRCEDTSVVDQLVSSSLTEFNGLMELDASQLTDNTPRVPASKLKDSITERTNEEGSSKADHVSKLELTMGESNSHSLVTTYRESLKKSSLDSMMEIKVGEGGPNCS